MKVPKPLLMTKLMSIGLRMPPDRTPAEAGLSYEDVEFTASDHLDIKGWFVPAPAADGPERGPVVLFVHGWMWNRMGNVAGRVQVATLTGLSATDVAGLTTRFTYDGATSWRIA